MRLVQTSSLWGNGRRHRYFINGKRVSCFAFDKAYADAGFSAVDGKSERSSSIYRTVWENTQ